MVPKTTYTAAAGAQNMWFEGEIRQANSGDVINIMVLGQAGDTAVIGSIRISCDDALAPTTYGTTLDVAATGEAGLDFNNIKAATGATTLTNITVPTVTTLTNANPSTTAIDTALSSSHGSGAWGGASGSGSNTFNYTLTDSGTGLPIATADVWVTSDLAGANVVASGQTNTFGVVTFYLDAGAYYLWRQKSGYDFTNPDLETVV
jgi:hypothetical protein